jgi:predicted RNase H-like HicB family nuclease
MKSIVKKYAVIIEKAPTNYSAYVPDLAGCIATGRTLEAIEFHIQGMIEDGESDLEPSSRAIEVEVSIA